MQGFYANSVQRLFPTRGLTPKLRPMKHFTSLVCRRNAAKLLFSVNRLAAAVLVTGVLGACTETITTHGQVILPSRLAQVEAGQTTKSDVQRLLGSPSSTGTFDDNRWYYVTSTLKDKPLNPDIVQKREVVVIQFDPSSSIVTGVERKTETDGRQIEPDDHITATQGQSLGVVDSMIQSIGGGLGGGQ